MISLILMLPTSGVHAGPKDCFVVVSVVIPGYSFRDFSSLFATLRDFQSCYTKRSQQQQQQQQQQQSDFRNRYK
jgi:hypothetical protein